MTISRACAVWHALHLASGFRRRSAQRRYLVHVHRERVAVRWVVPTVLAATLAVSVLAVAGPAPSPVAAQELGSSSDAADVACTLETIGSDEYFTCDLPTEGSWFDLESLPGTSDDAPIWIQAWGGGSPDVGDLNRTASAVLPPEAPVVAVLERNPPGGGALIAQRLEAQGHEAVVVQTAAEVEALQPDAVVVSQHVDAAEAAALAGLPIPLLSLNHAAADELWLAGNARNYGSTTTVYIVDRGHDMVQGFVERPKVLSSPAPLVYGDPGPGAVVSAVSEEKAGPAQPERPTLFSYETGAEMIDGNVAPARRVRFFTRHFPKLHGAGTAIFDQAIGWLLAD